MYSNKSLLYLFLYKNNLNINVNMNICTAADILSKYYLDHIDEFKGECGHNKLLIGLKENIKYINDDNLKVIGIDVGSCIGDYIQTMDDICFERNKNILCFEPNPSNITTLETKINNNIKLFKHCLSNETTSTSLYNWVGSSENISGNGVAGLRSGGYKICDVLVKKLDDVLDDEFKNDNLIIKFIKIDTEGNDGNVIKGMKKYLPKTKYIIFECSDCLDDIRGPNIKNPMKDIVDFLSTNGFDTYRIGTQKLFKVNDEYWRQIYDDVKFWSNCFAIKKNDTLIYDLVDSNFDYKF